MKEKICFQKKINAGIRTKMTSRTLPENILWNNQCSTDGNHNNLDPCHSLGPIWLNRMTNYYCNKTVETLWLKYISHQQELLLLLVALKNSKWTPLCRSMLLNDPICKTQYPTKCWVCARSTMKIRKKKNVAHFILPNFVLVRSLNSHHFISFFNRTKSVFRMLLLISELDFEIVWFLVSRAW